MSGSTCARSCPGSRRQRTDRVVGGEPTSAWDEGALRALVPQVLAGLVRRGEQFDAAEDALQEALLEALRVWPEQPPRDPRAWLTTVATRRLVDARRSEAARQRREEEAEAEPPPATAAEEVGDDTLFLLFRCCHPALPPASQVALTLRAVGGLTTREIADAFYVPEATMAQRISRAKRTLRGRRLDRPGDLAVVLRVLYLVYTTGHAGRVDLAREAIRLARQLTLATAEPEARGLLALMLLNHARLARADRRRGPPGHARPAGPQPLGPRRDRRRRSRPAIGAGAADGGATAGPLPARGRDRRSARRRGEYRGDRLAADPLLVRRPRRAHRRPGPQRPCRRPRTRRRARPRPRRRRRPARERPPARRARRTPSLARRPRSPARAGRRPSRRRGVLRRGRPPRHEHRRARPPHPPGGTDLGGLSKDSISIAFIGAPGRAEPITHRGSG